MPLRWKRPMAADRPRAAAGAILVAALLIAGATLAHRGHAVWTDIAWNGDYFEVTHRMHLADAISVNRFVGGTAAIEELRSLARVALYVEERFLLVAGSDTVTLQTLGAEIEDDFLFVYQEWHAPLPEAFPEIENRILLDVEPGAQAFIYIAGPGIDEERQR